MSASAEAGSPREALVLLRMGALALLARQGAVHSVESRAEIERGSSGGHAAVTAAPEGHRWPIYCLDERLAPLAAAPEDRRICVLLRAGSGLYGLLVNDVVPWTGRTWQGFELPACARVPGLPLEGLALEGDAVYGVLSARGLADWLCGAAEALPRRLREAS